MHETGRRTPFQFFVLVFLLTTPFLVLGAATGVQLLPGIPLAALAVVGPVTAAVILLYSQGGAAGVRALLKRSFDYRRGTAVWYIPALLLPLAVAAACYLLQRWQGVAVPPPAVPGLSATILFVVFFVAALGEELGWSGYVLDPLQERFGALTGSLVLGIVWAVWHYIPLYQAGESLDYIAWWTLGTLAMRVAMVWLYNGAGRSVFAVALFHAMSNLAWQLYPVQGSFFDPRLHGLIMTGIALIIIVIAGPRTLSRPAGCMVRPLPRTLT